MRKLMLFLALALAVVLFVAPAFAEVQNVKVGGDVDVRTIARENFDLHRDNNTSRPSSRGNPDVGQVAGVATGNRDSAIMSTTGIDVNADLTDNVGVGVRLVNQRDWGVDATGMSAGSRDKVALDLAFVTLKEFFYQPLTVVVGRQDLWFGKGFIVGSRLLAHPVVSATGVGTFGAGTGVFPRGANDSSDVDQGDAIMADEFSALTSFDVIRGTFDLNPWTIDVIYSVINNQPDKNDVYLTGANVGYKFDSYNAEAEGYYFFKYDRNIIPGLNNDVNTVGLRGSLEPIGNMNLWTEGAYQFGTYNTVPIPLAFRTVTVPSPAQRGNQLSQTTAHRAAFAFDAGVDYTWKDISYQPKLGAEFIYYSGEGAGRSGTYTAWDQMYRGKFDTLIREFQGGAGIHYSGLPQAANLYDTDDPNDQPSFTNQMQFSGTGAAKLMDSLNLSVKGTYFSAATSYAMGQSTYLGWELDTNLSYDYTEDVHFGLVTGWFFPGTYFDNVNTGSLSMAGDNNFVPQGNLNPAVGTGATGAINSVASTVMTTMKVDF